MKRSQPVPFSHDQPARAGILLANLGTPDAPTPAAVRRYLAEFLWDPRVVELPRPLWWLILHGIILRVRPARSARKYQTIWTPDGSPLLTISQRQAAAVAAMLMERYPGPIQVAIGMRYGNPSIAAALAALRAANVRRLLVLPPSGLSPYAMAIASTMVDFPTPFSPTRIVNSDSSRPWLSNCATCGRVNGQDRSSVPGSPTTSRNGSELNGVTRPA